GGRDDGGRADGRDGAGARRPGARNRLRDLRRYRSPRNLDGSAPDARRRIVRGGQPRPARGALSARRRRHPRDSCDGRDQHRGAARAGGADARVGDHGRLRRREPGARQPRSGRAAAARSRPDDDGRGEHRDANSGRERARRPAARTPRAARGTAGSTPAGSRAMNAATAAGAPKRIASLLASGTELVCALGLGERLVARSHECDFPAWVKRLPGGTRPTFDIEGRSADIDARVRERLRAGAPLYEVDEALLASLAPDVIVTQTHCEVCAVSPGDLAHGRPPTLDRRQVVALESGTIDGILDGFQNVAGVLGAKDAGRALVADIRARMAA